MKMIFALALLALWMPVHASTYYVRTDGGPAPTCNGTANAPATAAPACAFNNPQWAIPPGFSNDGAKPTLLKAGDTLQIAAGTYQLGYGTPGAGACYTNYSYNCIYMPDAKTPPLPDNVTITGDCGATTKLTGVAGIGNLINLSGTMHPIVKCLELTDTSLCIVNYAPTTNTGGAFKCPQNGTSAEVAEPFASVGIYVKGASDLTLDHLNIHGFADRGVMAGSLTGNTNVTYVTIRANGWAGWDGDLGGNNGQYSNSGTLTFDHLAILWNGCGESADLKPIGCFGQNEGGYGDGFAGSFTSGKWVFKSSQFNYNTSDGLDLLYADGTGSVAVDSSIAWDNAGNGIKTTGTASLINSVVNGYCNNWKGFPIYGDGSKGNSGTMCRADGTAVVMEFNAKGQTATLDHDTITGNGDTLFVGGGNDHGYTPDSSNVTTFSNSILLGQTSVIPRDDGGLTALDWYTDGTYAGKNVYVNNVIWRVKGGFCPAGNICKDPLLQDESLATFNWHKLPGSPAIGTGAQ